MILYVNEISSEVVTCDGSVHIGKAAGGVWFHSIPVTRVLERIEDGEEWEGVVEDSLRELGGIQLQTGHVTLALLNIFKQLLNGAEYTHTYNITQQW